MGLSLQMYPRVPSFVSGSATTTPTCYTTTTQFHDAAATCYSYYHKLIYARKGTKKSPGIKAPPHRSGVKGL